MTRTLRNAVGSGRTVHAYLFCGPRGTGKTSTARILAKAVNCHDPQEGEPCNRCPSCLAVNAGRAIDLIEIDAASNRGIDDARDLREKIKFSPAEFRFKVYIIDEAHMLTSEASNALLKTLEEPPEHAILILATTESHKILPTISSRCQRFDFRRIPMQAIVERLDLICREEGLQVGDGVLERVARLARGSLRDAESLLDQLVAYCGDRVDLASARDVLGLAGEEMVPAFAEALRTADLAAGFSLIDEAAGAGADLRHLARELVDYLRALAVAKSEADTSLVRELRVEDLAHLRQVASLWDYRQIAAALKAFGDLEGRMRLEPFNQSHLELALLEVSLDEGDSGVARTPVAVPPEAVPVVGLPAGDAEPRTAVGVGIAGRDSSIPRLEEPAIDLTQAGDQLGSSPAEAHEPEKPIDGAPESEAESAPLEALDLAGASRMWPRILRQLGAELGAAGIALQGGAPVEVSGNTVVLGFEKSLWRKRVEQPRVREMLEEGFSQSFSGAVRVQFKFGVRPERTGAVAGRDAVVEAAIKELGFEVARVEPVEEPGS